MWKLLVLFLIPTLSFAQTRGYVGGIRLDSISAKYALVEGNGIRYSFDYGQNSKTFKEMAVKDEAGKEINPSGLAGMLNLMDFNGWELVEIVGGGVLLRKKTFK